MSKYIRYEIKNIEPLRIADDSNSQTGQVACLRYIPGTAIRGVVVNKLSKRTDFESIKPLLFSNKVRFLNAYISDGEIELIPSPKGFYENKEITEGKKNIENVVINGDFTPGYKRSSLGRFCYFENDTINYYSVETGSDLKIKVNLEAKEKQNVFRNDYIKEGYKFVGYIAVEDENLIDCVKELFSNRIFIGSARSQGLGKCEVLSVSLIDDMPYSKFAVDEDVKDFCYMYLASDMTMVNSDGEICGIDEATISKMLEVNVHIDFCATSTTEIEGYNRTLKTKTPSVIAYEMGSVFKLSFPGKTIAVDKLRELQNWGIGINKNVGMGRIIFLKDYERLTYKEGKEVKKDLTDGNIIEHSGDRDVLAVLAKNYLRNYVKMAMEKAVMPNDDRYSKININNSQVGNVTAIIRQNLYNPNMARETLNKYFKHANEKENRYKRLDNKNNVRNLEDFIYYVLDNDISTVFNSEILLKNQIFGLDTQSILTDIEKDILKLQFILKRVSMENRKG